MPRTLRKGLGRYALAQLRSDLKLSPEARVLEAEEPQPEVVPPPEYSWLPREPDPWHAPSGATHLRERPVPVPADKYPTKLALVCSVLNAARAKYVLVGAKALQVWGTSRYTKDIDILIEPTQRNAERVLKGLSRIGFGVAADFTAEEVLSRHVTIIGDTPRVDILTRAWNLKWEVAAAHAVTFDVDGVSVPTASLEDLIESKRTGRPQDAIDIEVLEAIRRERAKRSK